MRVLHVISGLPRAAGTSVFCAELCNHLATQGVECCVAVHQRRADDYVVKSGIPVVEIGSELSSLSFKPDIVHIHALWDPFLHKFASWARRKNIPLVCSPHGMLTPWALNQKRIKKWLALALYQYGDLRSSAFLHATAASEVEDIRRVGLNRPVVVAPLGVDLPAADCDAEARRRGEPRIALFVSRVHPKKGLFNLVDAWANVRPTGWKMIIAGPDGDGHAADVMARARAAGVERDFEMIGPVFGKEKENLYAKADLFVLPTYSENFGAVVIEALSHGCPVITTKGAPWGELQGCPKNVNSKPLIASGGQSPEAERKHPLSAHGLQLSDFTANGRCGWWIDIGVEPLVLALREATSLTDDERAALGENGRCLVQAKYAWPAIAADVGRGYDWILTGGLSPVGLRL